jgi:16S rRNA (cytosine967-C5)-methyltransferase
VFLADHSNAQLERVDVAWGTAVAFGQQLLPAVDGPDGLFYALLRKTG